MSGMKLSPEQAQQLARLAALTEIADVQAVVQRLEPEVPRWVGEVMEPDQPTDETRIELAALYLLAVEYGEPLAAYRHDAHARERFADAVVAWRTFEGVYKSGLKLGDYRPRTAAEAVAASLPARDRARRAAAVVFFNEPVRRAVYQDHNVSGTLDEEIADLRQLVTAARRDLPLLAEAGFGPDELAEAERLLAEAERRDVAAVLGIQTQADLRTKRNTYLTLAVTLARYLRACAEAAFFDAPEAAERFRKATFNRALRRLRPNRRAAADAKAEAPSDTEAPSEAEVAPTPGTGMS